jgi:GT2 family glycosyltransferase
MALVLTFEAPEALDRCLGGLAHQSHPISEILVVDNAADPQVDVVVGRHEGVQFEHLPENLGPAGGHAEGLRRFHRSRHAFAWVMDDDCVPDPDALDALLGCAGQDGEWCVALPTAVDEATQERVQGHGWLGALIPWAIVDAVGVPNEELFWWTEDTEYLQWRIPRAGFDVRWSDEAVVAVSRARAQTSKPAWKYYYESRNQVFYRLHVQKQPLDGPPARHLRLRVRGWRALKAVAKLATRATVRERDGRARKLLMILRGTRDGLLGRLGRTVIPDTSHRPSIPPAMTDT